MKWTFRCLTKNGKEVCGAISGTRDAAAQQLRDKGLLVIDLNWDWAGIRNEFFIQRKLDDKTLVMFFEDLQEMFKAGIPLRQIFFMVKETAANRLVSEVIDQMQSAIASGKSLTEAFEQTGAFPWIVISAASAGEKAGVLAEVTRELAKHFRRRLEVRERVAQALVYPVGVLIVILGLMLFICGKVIPQLSGMLPPGAWENPATRLVLGLSRGMRQYGFCLLFLPLLGFGIWQYFKQSQNYKIAEFCFAVPLLGRISKYALLSLFFLNLSLLQRSGVTILHALQNIVQKTEHRYVARQFRLCHDYILGGLDFSQAMEKTAFFPAVAVFNIKKGEQSGNYAEHLEKTALILGDKANRLTDTLVSLLNPALIFLAAGFLGLVAVSFLGPVYGSLSAMAGGG
ncbi:MAG: type II secretion system F family protein [Candidatus Omnitrophica bacterium]|nr:type II secretion system F family protein [Candidatus Omnitrophota bacterium]